MTFKRYMIRFQIGDEVQVHSLTSSDWCGLRGVVVKTIDRQSYDGTAELQECAVQFDEGRRWFLANHLVRATADKHVRFFRAEVLGHWQLDSSDVAILNGDRDGLVHLLQDRLSFARRRAEAEADAFIAAFGNRVA